MSFDSSLLQKNNPPYENHTLLHHDPGGVGKVIDALRYLLRKGEGADDVRRELAFFLNNRRRGPRDRFRFRGIREQGSRDGPDEALRSELGPRRRTGRPDLPGAPQVRAPPPGLGRAGVEPEPPRRLETPGMRQRERAVDAGRTRRVIRKRNIMESKSEPYENRTPGNGHVFWICSLPPTGTAERRGGFRLVPAWECGGDGWRTAVSGLDVP